MYELTLKMMQEAQITTRTVNVLPEFVHRDWLNDHTSAQISQVNIEATRTLNWGRLLEAAWPLRYALVLLLLLGRRTWGPFATNLE